MSSYKDLAGEYEWTPIGYCDIDRGTFENLVRPFPGYDAEELCRNGRRIASEFSNEARNNRELWEKVFCTAYDDNCSKNCEDTMTDTEKSFAKKAFEHDNVNHPSHYTKGGIECIDAIKASMSYHEYHGYLKGNAIKYLWRYRLKGHAKEDLKKAQWYLNKLVEELD